MSDKYKGAEIRERSDSPYARVLKQQKEFEIEKEKVRAELEEERRQAIKDGARKRMMGAAVQNTENDANIAAW